MSLAVTVDIRVDRSGRRPERRIQLSSPVKMEEAERLRLLDRHYYRQVSYWLGEAWKSGDTIPYLRIQVGGFYRFPANALDLQSKYLAHDDAWRRIARVLGSFPTWAIPLDFDPDELLCGLSGSAPLNRLGTKEEFAVDLIGGLLSQTGLVVFGPGGRGGVIPLGRLGYDYRPLQLNSNELTARTEGTWKEAYRPEPPLAATGSLSCHVWPDQFQFDTWGWYNGRLALDFKTGVIYYAGLLDLDIDPQHRVRPVSLVGSAAKDRGGASAAYERPVRVLMGDQTGCVMVSYCRMEHDPNVLPLSITTVNYSMHGPKLLEWLIDYLCP